MSDVQMTTEELQKYIVGVVGERARDIEVKVKRMEERLQENSLYRNTPQEIECLKVGVNLLYSLLSEAIEVLNREEAVVVLIQLASLKRRVDSLARISP